MVRTSFLVDGFNLYHSVKQASYNMGLGGKGTKWLDIRKLCESYLHHVEGDTQIADVFYFSALARHLEASNPDVTRRHTTFIQCLESTGIKVVLGRFKRKQIPCPHCGQQVLRHEEKETDVAISATLLEVFMQNQCDAAVILSGDTDIAPAVRIAKRLFGSKQVYFAFPYGRKNKELQQLAHGSWQIGRNQYLRYQFPDPVTLPDGTELLKPAPW